MEGDIDNVNVTTELNMDYPSFNISNVTNTTDENNYISDELYSNYIPLLLAFCVISIIYNLRVLISVHWIRRTLSPTLHISLSLAAADACTSALLCIGLLLNSYLNIIQLQCYVRTTLEMFRLSGVIITVIHLLALSINHWLGILKPLHYNTLVTSTKIISVIVALWIIPIAIFMITFGTFSNKTMWESQECPNEPSFLDSIWFRISFSLLFFIPLILMVFCYVHILIIVKRHQRKWAMLSRSGSKKNRSLSRPSAQQNKTMEGNVKAVYTTLLILGSCMIGWLPATLEFVLICNDCIFSMKEVKLDHTTSFFIKWTFNMLVILKTLANPIIYSARMIEIKEGMRRMDSAFKRLFFRLIRRDRYSTNLQAQQLGYSGSVNAGGTALCIVNGSGTRRSKGSNYPNTLV